MPKKGKSSNNIVSVILIGAVAAGVSLLLYPTLAQRWNRRVQSDTVSKYKEIVEDLSNEEYDAILEEAYAYQEYWKDHIAWSDSYTDADMQRYYSTLLTPDSDVMAYVEIPNINVYLPVYHGTSDEVLHRGVGHLEWSALPIGGEGTHSALSGHRGLPGARLFTDLPDLIEGDFFVIHVLNEMFTYEVDQILIVMPENVTDLAPVAGKDYCTLVTCTPYSVNSHRLLVRGHRVDNAEMLKTGRIEANAVPISTFTVALFLGVPVIVFLFFFALIFSGRGTREKEKIKAMINEITEEVRKEGAADEDKDQ